MAIQVDALGGRGNFQTFIGRPLESVRQQVAGVFEVRPVRVDGNPVVIDLSVVFSHRINVEIQNGLISAIVSMG